jgi:ketosteroid isomerase-like protein
MLRVIGVATLMLLIGSSSGSTEDLKLPPLKRQSTPQAVVDEHLNALNECDWARLMAQYPADYQLNLPDGIVVKGREAAGKLFADFVKSYDHGGLCGIKFTPEQTSVVGDTLNIQWKAEAQFLAEPYKGSDAYETHDGLLVAMVSTFKGSDLKQKK